MEGRLSCTLSGLFCDLTWRCFCLPQVLLATWVATAAGRGWLWSRLCHHQQKSLTWKGKALPSSFSVFGRAHQGAGAGVTLVPRWL